MRSIGPFALLALLACHSPRAPAPVAAPDPVPIAAAVPPPPPPPPSSPNLDLDSHDILARPATTTPVLVKHVLLAWAELAPGYHGRLDRRAAQRTQADAAKLAVEIAAKLRADPSTIDAVMAQYSEDPSATTTTEPYVVTSESPFIPEFKNLGLRLELGEVGIVAGVFGYHVMLRVAPPPPDPLESADILARAATAGPVEVQHILIGWQGLSKSTHDPRADKRTKAEADALASAVLAKVRAGGAMAALMKQYSEDPGSSATGKPYTVVADSAMVEPFKQLALRLKVGEAGLVKTGFGWHVVKRVPPPPPDPLESTWIMQREIVVEHARVKPILLGWNAAHAADPRGVARTRAQLENLVKNTLVRLARKGAAIEPIMAELSEDPGSAQSGDSYEVTPTAGLVQPFKNLSLRLRLNEVGIVKTEFGIHIVKRVE